MEITLLKGHNSMSHCNVVHKPVPLLQAMKTPDAKAAVDKGLGERKNWSAWQESKVKKQRRSYREGTKKAKTDHCATLMALCHLKNFELDKKFQTYKGRVVLRGDVAKDDSGSYSVFTER